jgi:hypothetical protein
MRRFICWLFSVMLAMGLMLAAVMGLARQDQTPTLLQRIGYGVCDGQPCFRGVTLGMAWQDAQTALKSQARVIQSNQLAIDINEGNLWLVSMTANTAGEVNGISTVHLRRQTLFDVRLGEVLLTFGIPCGIGGVIDVNVHEERLIFLYPTMAVVVKSWIVQNPTPIVMVRPTSRIENVWIAAEKYANGFVSDCVTAPFSLWRGFASSETYLREPRIVRP